MKLLPRYSLWTLLWLAVLIGAGMGLYAKREPWREVWSLSTPELKGNLPFDWGWTETIALWERSGDGSHLTIARVDLKTATFISRVDDCGRLGILVGLGKNGVALFAREYKDRKSVEFVLTRPDHTETLLERLPSDWPLGRISADGQYAAIRTREEIKVYSTNDGNCIQSWKRNKNSAVFIDTKPFRLPDGYTISFHPTEPRVLVHATEQGYQEWDLAKKVSIRDFPDEQGKTYAENKRFEFYYLRNGNILRRWYGNGQCGVTCFTPGGKERWNREGDTGFLGDQYGVFEADLAVQYRQYKDCDLIRARDGVLLPRVDDPMAVHIFPDARRGIRGVLRPTLQVTAEIFDLQSGQAIAEEDGWEHPSVPGTLGVRILDDDHVLAHDDQKGVLELFKRVRREGHWGWLYVPESYVAALAVVCLFISLFKRLRSKKV